MKTKVKIILCLLLAAVAAALLSGCFRMSAEDLYSLPEYSEENMQIQSAINAVLAEGAEYSPPIAGNNRQSIQMRDLDGDGVNEAIGFFTTSKERPLRIYIFKNTDGVYKNAAMIEGDGIAIERVNYADLDGDGTEEVLVGWQMSTSLQFLDIYSIKNYQPVRIEGSDYYRFALVDMDKNGRKDVIVIHLPGTDTPAQVQMLSVQKNGEVTMSTARLSDGIEAISRISEGSLADGSTAIYVEGVLYATDTIMTDIVGWNGTSITNITIDSKTGVSEETARAYSYAVYSTDINNDGILEVPAPFLFEAQQGTSYRGIDWYSFSTDGKKQLAITTYDNYIDGWRLVLPDALRASCTVRRVDIISGERTIIFSYIREDGSLTDFLKIYTLTGDNREERCGIGNRFRLRSQGVTVYAGEILVSELPDITLSEEMVKELFGIIYSAWNASIA